MPLSYRGITYDPQHSSAIAPEIAAETEQTGIFLGTRYTMKHFNLAERKSSGSARLSYRGVSYTR